jgi:type II secretory ATPase GspE/PulE/Tfp pilus assembly ATPase PilB-like protein
LARTICPSCLTSYYPPADLLESVGWEHRTNELFSKGEGCRGCHNTGFKGRIGIYEIMTLDAELRRLIQNSANEADLRTYLARIGFRTLREKALDVVEQGRSTLEEVLRVTRAESGDPVPAVATAPEPDLP